METINATNARKSLYGLIEEVNTEAEEYTIISKRGKAVLVGEEEWRSIQETLYLNSIPGMSESILQAKAEPLSQGSQELDW